MQPFRQERICVYIIRLFDLYPVVAHQLLQPSIIERIKCLGASADMLITDEDLRNGGRTVSRMFSNRLAMASSAIRIAGKCRVGGEAI
jgi:hypothetical protein